MEAHDPYFVLKRNAVGVIGLSSLQKTTAAMRILAYGVAADIVDDYVRIGESISIESLRKFVRAVVEVFVEEYLRSTNNDDISRLLAQGEVRWFPVMLGSIDCMHWKWKNCPIAWKDQYERGGHHDPSIILEAVTSSKVDKEGCRASIWSAPSGICNCRGPSRFWDVPMLKDIMKACIIMHNIIVEDEHDVYIPDLNCDPKWMDDISKHKSSFKGKAAKSFSDMSSPSTPDSPINLADDDVPNTDFVQRPPDRNAEK
ncbi:hypothetical protein HHK36_033156 [Tetracentron sinense]|uniref:Nuclease HARBI1 n=1 Tax=Tetracentron sinense TaxID=13715 RepID=A0A834Y9T2_TETSI|nr:hypothetical protein HHK36_033156 [Tetracentron sinense]